MSDETNEEIKQLRELLGQLADKRTVAMLTFMDRAVTVSTAALALSITFREKLAGARPAQMWLLKGCWIGLGLTVICGTVIHLGPGSAAMRAVEALRKNQHAAAAHPIYARLEFLALAGFLIGFVCLVAFGIVNADR
ncbi:MAG: hypothetical protein WCP35_07505 [Verrucomicrobiota bacterium]